MDEVKAKRPWAGYILSAIPILFLLMDSVGKFLKPDPSSRELLSLATAKAL